MRPLTLLPTGLLLVPGTAAYIVDFFISPARDLCNYKGVRFSAANNTDRGGVCAYNRQNDRVYGCPAPDPDCWTFAETCRGGTAKAGDGQRLCVANTNSWCCRVDEDCVRSSAINVCISLFAPPTKNQPIAEANAAEMKALGVTALAQITVTTQSADPTPFATLSARGVSEDETTSTSSASTRASAKASTTATAEETTTGADGETLVVAKTGSRSSTRTVTEHMATAGIGPTSPATEGQQKKEGMSGGAIAGIVVGALAIVALTTLLFVVMAHRRRRRERGVKGLVEMDAAGAPLKYEMPVPEKPAEMYVPVVRHEMPS
ncbi:hypothetical protein EJ06DRAFT_227330 [Trichodelitschia bisporula]|uniref:Mid2 domain-containing protein n=1 Tax=Trichodelitschia bisporula TaxID=703511 RepID=A0A6G1HKW1_9PEZI|nr:hypothetical protein EJ06DRAFT_227330 [Trichodelitschia bisporula]